MRPVSGFERPAVQWIYVTLGVVLIAAAATEAVGLRRARAQIESLRAADLNARIEREQLENRLTHEQATREALTLELARVRSSPGGAFTPAAEPTLTLMPLKRRGPQPPDPTMAQPPAAQSIHLRLVLPAGRSTTSIRYTIVVRKWSEGETVWQRGGVGASTIDGKPMAETFVTGDVFRTGAYEVLLTSMGEKPADVASYEIAVR